MTQPIGHGNHDNLYFLYREKGIKITINANFNTENAFILNCKGSKAPNLYPERKEKIYNKIKRHLSEYDFNLVTPLSEAFQYFNKDQYEDRKTQFYNK